MLGTNRVTDIDAKELWQNTTKWCYNTKKYRREPKFERLDLCNKVGNVHENENMKLNCGDVKKVTWLQTPKILIFDLHFNSTSKLY